MLQRAAPVFKFRYVFRYVFRNVFATCFAPSALPHLDAKGADEVPCGTAPAALRAAMADYHTRA
jgi:hypothetical protein